MSGTARLCRCLLLIGLPALGQAALPAGYEFLYLERTASPEVEAAARELAEFLEADYGRRPSLLRMPLFGVPRGVHIGPDPDNGNFDKDPLTDEVLVARSRRGIEIRGSDNTATVTAIFRFIEECLGWRQYQPGPLGLERLDELPELPAASGPEQVLLLEQAGFHSRTLDALGRSADVRNWEKWHGLRERFSFNHALHRILPPAAFGTHPDWFAKDAEGRPMKPPYDRPHGENDHPDLRRPGLRELVAGRTLQALQGATGPTLPAVVRSPGIISTSLSLADSFVFGEFPESYTTRPQGWFRRWPDWSNHVFAYTNAVAEQVTSAWQESQSGPAAQKELYLGALAYLMWENVPAFPVHPAIVPYLTYDRSQWHDPEARQDDLANVEAWRHSGVRFTGTWDYLFGYGFLIPRSLIGVVEDTVPALHARGVRAYFAQVAPVWPFDGHTTWLTARLLWNPGADAEALMEEWFREFFGPAARPMRRFFDRAEAFWMNQEGAGWWLRYWKDPSQVALWPPAAPQEMRALLDEARRLAESVAGADSKDGLAAGRFAARVDQVSGVFRLTEALFAYQEAFWKAQSVDWEKAGTDDLEAGLQHVGKALAAREELVRFRDQLVKTQPMAAHASDLEWVFRYDTLGAQLAAVLVRTTPQQSSLAGPRTRALELLRRWSSLASDGTIPPVSPQARQVLYDRRFSEVENPRIWHRHFLPSEGLRGGLRRSGTGYFVENSRRSHIYQLFEAAPGQWFSGQVDLATRQSPSGEIYIRLDFFDAENRLLTESPRSRIAPTGRFGENQRLRVLAQAPAEATHGRLFIRFYEMDPGSRVDLYRAEVLGLDPARNP